MRTVWLLGALLVAGCSGDPYAWQNHWNPTQANLANQAVQVADWRDLARGHGDAGADGSEAVSAVNRLRMDKVKRLPAATVSEIAPMEGGPNGGADSGSGSGSGGGAGVTP